MLLFAHARCQGYDSVARLELTLPPTVSCNKAELDTIAAIAANPTIYGKAFIKSHSGAALISANNGLETWIEVNPASRQWFDVNGEEVSSYDGAEPGCTMLTGTTGCQRRVQRRRRRERRRGERQRRERLCRPRRYQSGQAQG